MSALISQRSLLPADGEASKSYPANSHGEEKKERVSCGGNISEEPGTNYAGPARCCMWVSEPL